MIIVVTRAKQQELMDQDAIWYQHKRVRGTMLEEKKSKLMLELKFHLWKITTVRRPDLILELKIDKKIWICNMTCPQQTNIALKRAGKTTKYRQIAFKTTKRRPGYKAYVVPAVVGALGGDIKAFRFDLKQIF